MKRKICCVITARPSYARVKSALIAIKNNSAAFIDAEKKHYLVRVRN